MYCVEENSLLVTLLGLVGAFRSHSALCSDSSLP